MRSLAIPLLAAAAGVLVLAAPPAAALPLYAIDRGGVLDRLDPNDYSTLESHPITIGGVQVRSGNGLARNPLTGELYALVQQNPTDTGRLLVTLDLATGAASVVGDTGDRFAGISFDFAGTLYGVTGFGATAPNRLFTLSLGDGSSTLLTALSPQSNGESIAFNPLDGLLYRVTQGNYLTFQKIDPGTLLATNVAVTPADRVIYEPTALSFDPQTGTFLLAESEDNLFRLTPTGEVTLLATLETGQTKGLAFVPEPSTALLLGLGTLAALAVQRRRAPRLPR